MLKESQIEMLKDQLLNKKEQLVSQATFSQNIIHELHSDSSADELDYAEISSDSHNIHILRNKQLIEIQEIDVALNKIKQNKYGICEMCDEKIALRRLKVKPHAKFCIECREDYEKKLVQ